ncbi:MAG: hypothetical protein EPO51_20365 [Phenylobacterium sp.]|uniref:hypothetical protein n=1 Tax=Phenylobacterium sp. TaxID=1871053 RepID=UPI0012009B2E|nr:hypothetical protein [Phenylobacterium sp.]TAJ69883.1 MAG: hypothetical protein EPO51_20365 [Phenylobacterium sp.]
MQISVTTTPVTMTQAPVAATASASGASTQDAAASNSVQASDSAVVISLSDAAKAALAAGLTDSTDVTAPKATLAVDPAQALRDQFNQAIAALNDTSGAASVDDQLAAYKFVKDTLLNGPASQGQADPNLQYAVDLANSAFSQRADQVSAYMRSVGAGADSSQSPTWFSDGAKVYEQKLAAFDSLSAVDQQIYVGVEATYSQERREVFSFAWDQGAIITTPEEYRVNLQANADVMRALQVAMNDPHYAATTEYNGVLKDSSTGRLDTQIQLAQTAGDQQTVDLLSLRDYRGTASWTQRAQAYFAEYGPAPTSEAQPVAAPPPFLAQPAQAHSAAGAAAQRMVDALRTMNDPMASTDAKFAALADSRKGTGVLYWLSLDSGFSKQVTATQNAYSSAMAAAGRAAGGAGDNFDMSAFARYQAGYLDRLSADDQRAVAFDHGYTDVDAFRSYLTEVAEQAERAMASQAASAQPDSKTPAERALDTLMAINDKMREDREAAAKAADKADHQPKDANAAALTILQSAADARQTWLDDLKDKAAKDAQDAGEKSANDPASSKSGKTDAIGSTLDQVT